MLPGIIERSIVEPAIGEEIMFFRGRLELRPALIGVCLLVALPALCQAQTLVVSNLDDAGPGSLRQAITEANGLVGAEIKFTVTGTIILESTLPAIATTMTISGPPAPGITISGNNAVRLMEVGVEGSLTLDNLTLINGLSVGSPNGGTGQAGAILNRGILAIHHCTLANNVAKGGSIGGSATGGAIVNNAFVEIDGSTFTANQALGVQGGGPLPIPGSGRGGGIYNNGTLIVTNSTLQGNVARGGFPSGGANGGGVLNNGGDTNITNATFSGNQSNSIETSGGAIESFGGTVKFKGTIFTTSQFENCAGSLTDAGYNLADDSTCNFTMATSQVKTAAEIALDPMGLQNNGGTTQTIALESGSVAINQIPIGSCTDLFTDDPLSVDQRGYDRPGQKGGNCSIGAYEFQSKPSIDCSEAQASKPILLALGPIFFPEQVTGVTNPNGPFGISVSGVTQSKPVPRFFCPDAKVNGQTTYVRANNQGRGGLEYQIGFTATDRKTGDSCDGTVSVCVQSFGQLKQPCVDTGESYDAINCGRR
jgi:hypothetical protein